MVVFIPLFQSAQDADGRSLVRLIDTDLLETTFQRLVFLEVFLIFLQGGCAYRPQLSSRQGGFQDVRRVHSALAASRAHKGVYLVYEQDNLTLALHHFVDHALQSLFKLPLIFCACHQRSHVKAEYLLCFQVLRHIASHDSVCQAFGYGGFSYAWLTDQDWIVFRPAAQYLQHASDFVIPAYHGVQFSCFRLGVQVHGIFFQTPVRVLRALAIHFSAFSQFRYGGNQRFLRHSCVFQNVRRSAVDVQQRQQQILQRDELVSVLSAQLLRFVQGLVSFPAQIRFAPLHFRIFCDGVFHFLRHACLVRTRLFHQEVHHVLARLHHSP